MTVAIISDTHIPERETDLPSEFRERITAADHVIHAGDYETEAVLTDTCEIATDLTAVYGNADPHDSQLPPVDAVTIEKVIFVLTHGMRNHVKAAVHTRGSDISRDG